MILENLKKSLHNGKHQTLKQLAFILVVLCIGIGLIGIYKFSSNQIINMNINPIAKVSLIYLFCAFMITAISTPLYLLTRSKNLFKLYVYILIALTIILMSAVFILSTI